VSKCKKNFLLLVIVIIIIAAGSILYLAVGKVIDTNSVHIENLKVDNDKLQVRGTTFSSAEAFDGYNYTINDNSLYLKLRYSIVNPIHHDGDFNIILHDNLKNIKYIYIQGKRAEDKKLIWTK
jgi:hypothetical protein